MSNQEILLESGNNEMEIIEFYVSGQPFGVNVAKVNQIIQFEEKCLTNVPNSRVELKGTYQYREHTMPLINLQKALNKQTVEKIEKPLILITEFNDIISGFTIDGVDRIHRVNWNKLQPMGNVFASENSTCIGTIHIEERDIVVLDLEAILAKINPSTIKGLKYEKDVSISEKKEAEKIKLYFAEDSGLIRNTVVTGLKQAGFQFAGVAEDGLKAWNDLEKMADDITSKGYKIKDFLNVVITDIEMPHKDGLTLCKNIKEHFVLNSIPVILFSSLISEQMAKKCDSVNADAYIAKPKTEGLIELIKKLGAS